jgi:hypothetical protein
MKPFLLCTVFLFVLTAASYGQGAGKMKMERQRNFENVFYRQIDVAVATKQPDTMRKPTATIKAANYLVKNNVYPTEDVGLIIYELNKNADSTTFQSTEAELALPVFTALSPVLLQQLNADYEIAKKNDPATNQLCRDQANTFNRNYEQYRSKHQEKSGFMDSLSILNNRLLPAIYNSYASTSKAKMEYFVNALLNINKMMALLLNPISKVSVKTSVVVKKLPGNAISREKQIELAIEALITDIWSAGAYKAGPVKAKFFRSGGNSASSLFYLPMIDFHDMETDLPIYFEETDNPANAAVYVFANSNGAQSSKPEDSAYQVYFGSNGLKYSLPFTTDTLSLFNFRPVNLASTLPLVLGTGNYCFILKDIKTGRLTVKPDVNLALEVASRDERGLIILPFVIYKQ